MPQATTPHPGGVRQNVKSVPKLVRVNAADGEAILYRNLGNGRRLPFAWATQVTLASGVDTVSISSGVEFHGYKVSEAGGCIVTPLSAAGAALSYYVDKDTTLNQVSLKAVAAPSEDCDFDVLIMLGTAYDFLSTHTNQIWK